MPGHGRNVTHGRTMTASGLVSYHGDFGLKERFVGLIEQHRLADQIVQGTYGTRSDGVWKGCAVGCSVRSLAIMNGEDPDEIGLYSWGNHRRLETDLGIPMWLARLEDHIFEALSPQDAPSWPGNFSRAIPVGIDLGPLRYRFTSFLLRDAADRARRTSKLEQRLNAEVAYVVGLAAAIHDRA